MYNVWPLHHNMLSQLPLDIPSVITLTRLSKLGRFAMDRAGEETTATANKSSN